MVGGEEGMMTTEEAIKVLRDIKLGISIDTYFDEPEKSVSKFDEPEKSVSKENEALEIAIEALEQQPTRPTGKWIKMPLIEAGQTYSHECSLCGRRILITDVGLSEFPYCHCGARMTESEDKNDRE